MNDWSREQHTKSGLIELIRRSPISLVEAETAVINFLQRYCASGTGILAGNSVFVDRWFVELFSVDDRSMNRFSLNAGLSKNTCHVSIQCFIQVSSTVRFHQVKHFLQ